MVQVGDFRVGGWGAGDIVFTRTKSSLLLCPFVTTNRVRAVGRWCIVAGWLVFSGELVVSANR